MAITHLVDDLEIFSSLFLDILSHREEKLSQIRSNLGFRHFIRFSRKFLCLDNDSPLPIIFQWLLAVKPFNVHRGIKGSFIVGLSFACVIKGAYGHR